MKKIIFSALLLISSLTAFANDDRSTICYTNKGAYIAHLSFKYLDGVSNRTWWGIHDGILAGNTVCSMAFYPSLGDKVSVRIIRTTLRGDKETCKYEDLSSSKKITSGGTTIHYWCDIRDLK